MFKQIRPVSAVVLKSFSPHHSVRSFGVTAPSKPMYYPPANKDSATNIKDVQAVKDAAHPVKDRPFTLPPGLYRPKQSLGQNFLSDQNYVLKIVNAFNDISENGRRVVEIGPGPGALTRELFKRYPDMTAVEIDERGIKFLNEKLPGLRMVHMDILKFDWAQAAVDRGGPVNIIANLPYSIVSQVLFGLADAHKAINKAVVTMQLEVGQRITAKPDTKDYGIPSVIFQLYGQTSINFHIPPTVFYPVPKVDSALLTIDFTKPHKDLHRVDGNKLRRVVTYALRQRKKMLRQSLKVFLETEGLTLPAHWGSQRAENMHPGQFIELTAALFGELSEDESRPLARNKQLDTQVNELGQDVVLDKEQYLSSVVWRKALTVNEHLSNKKKAKMAKYAQQQQASNGVNVEENEDIDTFEGDHDDEDDDEKEEEEKEIVFEEPPAADTTSRGRRNSRRYNHIVRKRSKVEDEDENYAPKITKRNGTEYITFD